MEFAPPRVCSLLFPLPRTGADSGQTPLKGGCLSGPAQPDTSEGCPDKLSALQVADSTLDPHLYDNLVRCCPAKNGIYLMSSLSGA